MSGIRNRSARRRILEQSQGIGTTAALTNMPRVERLTNSVALGGLLLLAMVVMFAATARENIGRDSGIFLYVGQRILAGDIPYREVWDHKGPVIFYVNALGLFIGQGSRYGVVFLEYVSLLGTVWLSYYFLQRTYGRLPAVFATILLLCGLTLLIDRGNWTEEYGLPLQLIALYSFWRMEREKERRHFPLIIGATGAAALLLRPNLVGIQLAIGLYMILAAWSTHAWRLRIAQLADMLAGALSVVLIVAIYFGYWGALGDLWDAAVRYNLYYSEGTLWNKLRASFTGFKHLSQAGVAFIGVAGWVIAGDHCLRPRLKVTNIPLSALALLYFPIEFALAGSSGRTYAHYYITWLPALTLLSSIFAWQFLQSVTARSSNRRCPHLRTAGLWLIAILGLFTVLPARTTAGKIRAALYQQPMSSEIVAYVQEHVPEHSYLLMWGHEAVYNFLTRRPAPTRFVHQSPLFMPGYSSPEMFAELLNDIAAKKPLIIDASARNRRSPPLIAAQRDKWPDQTMVAHAAAIFQYIDQHYEMIATLGEQQWPVFAYRR
jgi:hypothetical protein